MIKNGFMANVEGKSYTLEVNTNDMNLSQLALLLVCVHTIEERILDHIKEIPANYESDFNIEDD